MKPTAARVRQLVERLFATHDRGTAMSILGTYGESDAEPHRVRVAILKLSEGQLGQLAYYTSVAQQDFRDVLAGAEYPQETSQPTWRLPESEVERIRAADRAQYLDWLRAHTSARDE